MIRPLRRRHLLVWTGLALVLPAVFVAALATRPVPAPRLEPPSLPPQPGEVAWPGLPLVLAATPAGVRVRPTGPLPAPDLLVYASAARPGAGEPLPSDVVFLGTLGSGPSVVVPPAGAHTLVLYSLAHGEVVGSAPLPGSAP